MKKLPKKFKFIDLFSGIGGFRLALEKYGGKCVFSSDIDNDAVTTYEVNFNEKPTGDITKIKASEIPKHNVLCGGFPCQAFSISGKRLGFKDTTRGTLFYDIARIAEYHKPEILFLENVKNYEKHDNGRSLRAVYDTLENIGYDVYHKVLNASNFGAPTSRERIYIIGFRKDFKMKTFEYPKPSNEKIKLSDILEENIDIEKFKIERDDIKLYKNKLTDKNLFGEYPQRPIQIGVMNKGGQGERIYDPSGHAITLTAYGGGVAGKTGAYLIDGIVRRLTPRECARVMGFPENFIIPDSKSKSCKLFGNSVVVPVLSRVFNQILKSI